MLRWLRWKQDLSPINHKRSELGQDSCKRTKIRPIFWHSAKTERASQKYKNEIRSQRLRSVSASCLKLVRHYYCPCADVLTAGVWATSAAADHLSLNSTISVIVCWLYMETGLLLWRRLLAGDGNMFEPKFFHSPKMYNYVLTDHIVHLWSDLSVFTIIQFVVCVFRRMRRYKQTFKRFRYGAQSDAHTGLYSLPLSNLLGDWALDHQPCEWPTLPLFFLCVCVSTFMILIKTCKYHLWTLHLSY